jgi:hypothetical protein
VSDEAGYVRLTTFDVLAIPVLAGQAASFVAEGVQFSGRELGLVLEVAEVPVLAIAAEVPVS